MSLSRTGWKCQPRRDPSARPLPDVTTTDQLLALAQMAGDLIARLDRMEQQFATQSISLNAADKALAASLDGLRSLDAAALEARIAAIEKKLSQ